jgi:hypothetical protein
LNISAQASGESTINVTRSDFHYNKTNKANKINETSEINKIKEKDDSLKEKLKKHGFLE